MLHNSRLLFALLGLSTILAFQNCANPKMEFAEAKLGSLGVCQGVSCDLTPLTFVPAVTTVLIALGDESDNQLVVDGASSQLIAETVVRYSSPVANPKILLVIDAGAGSESAVDTAYARDVLLKRYNVTVLREPDSGLQLSAIQDYDLIWHNNPGAPMRSRSTMNAYVSFKGGVILQGDDLTWGMDSAGQFTLEKLTGLRHVDNGASVICDDGRTYSHDNNGGEKYRVTMDAGKITGDSTNQIQFRYGNDIDNSEPARSDLQVLAYAQGGPSSCSVKRPAIVRYEK